MTKSKKWYTVLSVFLMIFALLLPLAVISVVANEFLPEDIGGDAAGESRGDDLIAFFGVLSTAVIVLLTLPVTGLISCVLAGVAIGYATTAVAIGREEHTSVTLPYILRVVAGLELAVAALLVLISLVLLMGLFSL